MYRYLHFFTICYDFSYFILGSVLKDKQFFYQRGLLTGLDSISVKYERGNFLTSMGPDPSPDQLVSSEDT